MNKYALFTVGCNLSYLDITAPFMMDYCKKYNLDFVVTKESKLPNYNKHIYAAFDRYDIYSLLDKYDRVAYVDADIIIKKSAPNIFEVVPEDKFGVYYESDNFDRNSFIDTVKTYYNYHGLTRYFNSGVMVASKIHKPIFDMERVAEYFKQPHIRHGIVTDQDYLNVRVHHDKIPTCSLGYKYNYLIKGMNKDLYNLAHFVHFAGCWNKKVFIKKFLLKHPCN